MLNQNKISDLILSRLHRWYKLPAIINSTTHKKSSQCVPAQKNILVYEDTYKKNLMNMKSTIRTIMSNQKKKKKIPFNKKTNRKARGT